MRPFAILVAVLALLLALSPGPHASAAGMGGEKMASSQQGPERCASPMASHGKADRHDAGGHGKMSCCIGAVCVVAWLPAASVIATPLSSVVLDLAVADTFLTGRDVAPPIDPPRPFA
ncbi:hypothetical protein ANOBCDAF_01112 [Pleomorphomonas sp. T1.2MG-36]|uniref:hypothetical protein n=1 Tax=Pleomorphomonas sp. T1.2MG-36 TaxID=3041167 RepID=UPI00247749AF|nr:hypothetical protein [Pleomorphomonas sp. T1.2MG-36]CAI9403433.1 hypothetical protein ANOBCDAF_01112 [Pleomorphomonas sp. T1.2MG-36]